MKKITSLRNYEYKLAPQTPISAPKHLGRLAEHKLQEQLIINDFIMKFKEHILKENNLYSKQDVIWILRKYLDSGTSILRILEDYKELQRKEYRKKFNIK